MGAPDFELEVLEAARRGGRLFTSCLAKMPGIHNVSTYGRKLQLEFGRLATRVNISEMSRCWTEVS